MTSRTLFIEYSAPICNVKKNKPLSMKQLLHYKKNKKLNKLVNNVNKIFKIKVVYGYLILMT